MVSPTMIWPGASLHNGREVLCGGNVTVLCDTENFYQPCSALMAGRVAQGSAEGAGEEEELGIKNQTFLADYDNQSQDRQFTGL